MEPSQDQGNRTKKDASPAGRGFFQFLADQRTGIFVFFFGLFGVGLFVWLFALIFGFTGASLALPPSFDPLQFLTDNRTGILVFFLSLFALALLVQWFAWIFSLGRFAHGKEEDVSSTRSRSLRFLIADLLVKIIDDFRHLLALILVLIFGLALGIAMYIAGDDINQVKEAMQTVTATLGGLVGSIIGYYFGESTVVRSQAATPTTTTKEGEQQGGTAVQQELSAVEDDIEEAPLPLSLQGGAVVTPDNPDAPDNPDDAGAPATLMQLSNPMLLYAQEL